MIQRHFGENEIDRFPDIGVLPSELIPTTFTPTEYELKRSDITL